ncbi:MAG: hypothetical protein K2O10_04865, partial [Muribaculaceae bacterium]|nr:hypothetical protein [Muribaculaceae bacterium]
MKKLVLWLSLVLAIGLSAQSAWAGETPAQLWVSYDASDGNGWQWNKPMTKDADGSFSFVFPQVAENKLFFAITRVTNLSHS